MAFSREKQAEVLAAVSKHLRGDKCDVCLSDDPGWSVIGDFINGLLLAPALGSVPMIGLVCKVCGHIRFLSAIHLGVYPSPSNNAQGNSPNMDTPKPEAAVNV